MKTSTLEVTNMLSVLTVDEVERRFGEVPGVESATVNYAAKSATVRYDETLLDIVGMKILVHRRGQQSAGESKPEDVSASKSAPESDNKPKHKHAEAPIPHPALDSATPREPAVPKAAMPSPAAAPDEAQGAKPPPGEPPTPAAAAAPSAQTS